MSNVITKANYLNLLVKWKIPFDFYREDWATHNRNGKGQYGDMRGVMMHHTGSDGATADQNRTLWSGYAGLPGPLCHGGIAPNGKLWLTGWGRCNHAGLGDNDILRHVTREDYDPKTTLRPNSANVDGNAHFYGYEIMYSGLREMTSEQRYTATRLGAALCTYHDWKAHSVIGHGEWQPGKWDPGYTKGKIIPMGGFRTGVADQIKIGPKGNQLPRRPSVRGYTVKDGDTLYSIARRELGDEKRWTEIVLKNPSIIDLDPGKRLTLPSR